MRESPSSMENEIRVQIEQEKRRNSYRRADDLIIGDELYKLLGFRDRTTCFKKMTAEDARTCDLICGPHGRTILKMLQARKDK